MENSCCLTVSCLGEIGLNSSGSFGGSATNVINGLLLKERGWLALAFSRLGIIECFFKLLGHVCKYVQTLLRMTGVLEKETAKVFHSASVFPQRALSGDVCE